MNPPVYSQTTLRKPSDYSPYGYHYKASSVSSSIYSEPIHSRPSHPMKQVLIIIFFIFLFLNFRVLLCFSHLWCLTSIDLIVWIWLRRRTKFPTYDLQGFFPQRSAFGRQPPPSSTMFDDDPGIMSEAETASTGFRRGVKVRSSLPVVRTPSKTLERPLG